MKETCFTNIILMRILIGETLYKRGISYRQLAIMTGLKKSTIANYCNGIYSPRLDDIELIAKALKVKITDLFDSDYK